MAAPEPLKIEEGSTSNVNFSQPQPQPQACASSSSSSQPPPPAPLSPGFPAPLQLPSFAPSAPRWQEHVMHKNRLQEFAQRSNIALPLYQTVNEGHQHAPRFRSTVWVDGTSYTSQITFPQRKAAEQEVARIALECLYKKIRDEGCPLVCENTSFCKSILNEYATKMNLERPTYNTIRQEGLLPVFISSLVFNGTSYTGDPARNKKEAEQLAACAVILSILGNSTSGTMLFEIIKSKSKFYDLVKGKGVQCICASDVSPIATTGHASVTLDHKDKEVAGPVADNNNETKVELPESSRILSSCQEFHMPKQEFSPKAPKLPNLSMQPSSAHPIDDGSSSKKRRKNKKKANKKSRLESPLPIAAFPMNQVPPCSVAQ